MKLLIVTETIAGYGHEKAAKSIEKAFKEIGQKQSIEHDVKIISLLSVFNSGIERTIKMFYMRMIKSFPWLWQWMYTKESKFAFIFKELIAKILLLKVKGFIQKENPDIIVATHAAGLRTLAILKRKYGFRLAAVFTDYQLNQFWIDDNIDYFYVPHHSFKNTLIHHYHISSEKILVSGIPIDPVFAKPKASQTIGKQIKENKTFRILVMGGGLGLGGIKEVIKALQKIRDVPLEVAVITGTNTRLFNEMNELAHLFPYPITLYKFVDDIYSLMSTADLLISKAGGLTLSEAMATGLPVLIYKPLPGQEEKNVAFVTKENAAIRIDKAKDITYWVTLLYQNTDLLQSFKQKEKNLANPSSSIFIAESLLNVPGFDECLLKMELN